MREHWTRAQRYAGFVKFCQCRSLVFYITSYPTLILRLPIRNTEGSDPRSSPEVILLVYSPKNRDQLAGASVAKRERRVAATGMSFSQSAIRPKLTLVAVASSCRWVFFRPR